jgi:hypothetical protein
MEALLDICAAIMLLTGGFIFATVWLVIVILIVVEVRDQIKERKSPKEDNRVLEQD